MTANTKTVAHSELKPAATVQFISRTRAAEMLDSDPQLIDKLIRQGKLPAYKIGRKIIVRKDDLLRLVEEGRVL
jgi:excisionase family DNA binding protein